jgi:hypothetical protein
VSPSPSRTYTPTASLFVNLYISSVIKFNKL